MRQTLLRFPPIRWLSSIPFGVTTLVLILVYASIGSALPPVRGAIEISEMGYFQHWLFGTLIAVFCLSLVAATLLRVSWSVTNGGVLMVHVGLLLLCGGSYAYFAGKVEGDVIMRSPRVELVTMRAGPPRELGRVLAMPGEKWRTSMPAFGGPIELNVVSANTSLAPESASAVVQCDIGTLRQSFELTANQPPQQVVPGLGIRLLSFAPRHRFYDNHTPALYYRAAASSDDDWQMATIHGLPIYRERYLPADESLKDEAGKTIASKRTTPHLRIGGLRIPTGWFETWNLPIRLDTPDLPFTVEIDGYVPYWSRFIFVDDDTSRSAGSRALRPVLTPVERRRPSVSMRWQSAIRLHIVGKNDLDGWEIRRWCAFSPYPDHGEKPFLEHGIHVHPPGGEESYELLYSRARHELGAALGLRQLSVTFFPGGGATTWRSDFLVRRDGTNTVEAATVATNETHRVGDWTLFQSGADNVDHWSWTILGVGSRRGIWPMTIGSLLITIGMLYAFYVKPILRRRSPNGVPDDANSGANAPTAPPPDSSGVPDNSTAVQRDSAGVPEGRHESSPGRSPGNTSDGAMESPGGTTEISDAPAQCNVQPSLTGLTNCDRGGNPGLRPGLLSCCPSGTLTTSRSGVARSIRAATVRERLCNAATEHQSNRFLTGAARFVPLTACSQLPRLPAMCTKRFGHAAVLLVALLLGVHMGFADEPLAPSRQAVELSATIDWERASLIAVQHQNRYKTLDSFARESMYAMYHKESLPGLTPMASLCEWLFNREAYIDEPVVYLRDRGLRLDFTTAMDDETRSRILSTKRMTPRQLADPIVQSRISELEPRFDMARAINRVRHAEVVVKHFERLLRIVPSPTGDADDLWYPPEQAVANLPTEVLAEAGQDPRSIMQEVGLPIPGLSSDQAVQVVAAWSTLRDGWLEGNASDVQAGLDRLTDLLPTLAAPDVYPKASQRAAEIRYYAFGKFTWGWAVYFLGLLVSVVAMITRWRAPRITAMLLMLAALGLHAYGVGLRWYILDRIPVANMFEAVVAAAWIGVALALIAEHYYRTGVFLVAAHATGFFALIMAQFVIPGGGAISAIMGILDDVMLRIHTTMITAAYALIFLAAVIAVVYIFAYYFRSQPARSAEVGLMAMCAGLAVLVLSRLVFVSEAGSAAGYTKLPGAAAIFGIIALIGAGALIVLGWRRVTGEITSGISMILIAATALCFGDRMFVGMMSKIMIAGGAAWMVSNLLGAWVQIRRARQQAAAQLAGRATPAAPAEPELATRPLLAGAMPGDERGPEALPTWLNHIDWSHLIVLNMAIVLLFLGGIVLGALWADYSWGRPWGWDPKETFALNTWIIYAILIHVRFVVKRRGLWTAWLSVIGCLMMLFNWIFVNFYVSGLHSYA